MSLAASESAFAWCAGPAALVGVPPPIPVVRSQKMLPGAVWLALARRALATEAYEEALRCFDGAVKHEPELALAHLGRAVCLMQLEREDDAEKALGTIADLARGQEEVLYHLARMCARDGRVGIGVALLTEAVRAVPKLEEQAAKDPLFADHPAYLMAIGRL